MNLAKMWLRVYEDTLAETESAERAVEAANAMFQTLPLWVWEEYQLYNPPKAKQ